MFLVFFDDWKYDFFVRVVSFDNFITAPAIPRSVHNDLGVQHEHSPLDITTCFTLSTTLASQNHPSESPIPLSSLLGGPKHEERSQSAHHGDPPPELDPEPRILSEPSPNPSRDLIDPSEISVDGVPARPSDRPTGDLGNKITDGDHRR